jgi:AcrR family transcriptional regulator
MRHPEYEQSGVGTDGVEVSDGRLRIVRAAYPLFVERGYDAVSMQEIADAVPIHKATLYHHFQNKDDLFLAVVRMGMTRRHAQVEQFIREGGSTADQLTKVALLAFRDSQSEFGRLMTDARMRISEDQQQQLVERCSDPWTLYEGIFASAIETGELPEVDPTLAATMFVGLIHGQTWSIRTGRIESPLDEDRARLLVDTLFGGLQVVFRHRTLESFSQEG